jgi:hypothetical protein
MANATDESLEEKKEELLEAVERSEQELRAAMDDLATVAQRRLDLRERIAERPWAWLGGAFVAGLWLSRGSR